jgi:dihydrofolate reductase
MRKVKLAMQVSADGFSADAKGNTEWMVWNWSKDWTWDNDLRQYHIDLTTSSDCLLLSRKMAEEGFHRHWEEAAADPANPQSAFAKPITDMKKLVFTTTLTESPWRNTDLVTGNLSNEMAKLKNAVGKDILIYGGSTLASAFVNADLIDEFHLFVNPAVLGTGRKMFKDVSVPVKLNLVSARPYPCGVAVIHYRRRATTDRAVAA